VEPYLYIFYVPSWNGQGQILISGLRRDVDEICSLLRYFYRLIVGFLFFLGFRPLKTGPTCYPEKSVKKITTRRLVTCENSADVRCKFTYFNLRTTWGKWLGSRHGRFNCAENCRRYPLGIRLCGTRSRTGCILQEINVTIPARNRAKFLQVSRP
jgi:hypothetical protein